MIVERAHFGASRGLTFCGCTCAGGEEQDPARETGQTPGDAAARRAGLMVAGLERAGPAQLG